jgi:hypothetical protein
VGVDIVAALGHPTSTMNNVLKEFERCRSVEHPKSTKRLQKLSKRCVGIIIRVLVQYCRQTLVDITNRSGVNVSVLTVRKALHAVGFTATLPKRNPSCLRCIELEGLSLLESIESG